MPTRQFVWDTVDDCVIQETDGAGTTLVTYTHEPNDYGPLLSQERGGQTTYYHFDAIGSTRFLTDDSQVVTDTYLADAWGNSVVATEATKNAYQWCGCWGYDRNQVTIDYYIRQRCFCPNVARWSAVDPLEEARCYRYAKNSPSLLIDPSGLFTVDNPKHGVTFKYVLGRCDTMPSSPHNKDNVTPNTTVVWPRASASFKSDIMEDRVLRLTYPGNVIKYIQLVTIDVTVTYGSCATLNCNMAYKDNPCCEHSYELSVSFVEELSKGDGHPFLYVHVPGLRIAALCDTITPCCPMSYKGVTTKRLARGPSATGADSNRTSKPRIQGRYKCCKSPIFLVDPTPPKDWPTRQGQIAPNLKYPDPVRGTEWTSTLVVNFSGTLCGNWQASGGWDGYSFAGTD